MPDRDARIPPTQPPMQVLITAAEAYPAFEQRVLEARSEIVMGFRIFDPRTLLRSDAAKRIGETWADLLADALARGVSVTLYLSDFDPLVATDLHRGTWRSVRILAGVRELAGPGAAPLILRPMLHPARIGLVQRLLFAPAMALRLRRLRRVPGHQPNAQTLRNPLPGLDVLRRHRGLMPAFPASHHQKLAVIDGRHLYIGGLDLDERRFDTPDHDRATQQTWHDVQLLLDAPELAQSALRHLHSFGDAVTGRAPPTAALGLVRTLSADRGQRNLWHGSPKTVLNQIAQAHHVEIARATDLIYLETQFFRDRRIARQLALRARDTPDLRLILVLPGAPDSVAFRKKPGLDGRFGDHLQNQCLRLVRRAFGHRLMVASPVQSRVPDQRDISTDRASLHGAPLVYLHAKVSVFDGRAAIVSSANLNGRSMRWDTEAGLHLDQPDTVLPLRDRVMGHWVDALPSTLPPDRLFDLWQRTIWQNADQPPEQRHGFLVPYDMRAPRATALPLPNVPEEMV